MQPRFVTVLLAGAILTGVVFLVLAHIDIVQIIGSHAGFQTHADEEMQNIAEFLMQILLVQFMRIFPPLEVNFFQQFSQGGFVVFLSACPENVRVQKQVDCGGMQIYGKAVDQEGTEYYMVQNPWGESGKYNGIWYASKAFVRYKTMNIVVHKDALPEAIKAKLGIK